MIKRQRGISIAEMLGALAIGSMMLVGLTTMIDRSMDEAKGQQASLYQAQIVSAAKKYIASQYADLKISPAVGAPPVAVSVNELITGKYLPAEFSTTNVYEQTTCLLIRQPVAGKLDALLVTSGGKPIEDREIVVVAMNAGQGGGYITKENPLNAVGGTWSMETNPYHGVACAGSGTAALTGTDGGHLASRIFYEGQNIADFLYRDEVPGMPELNTMNTPLRMDNSAIVTSGDACGIGGAIAADINKNILRCDLSGKWSNVTTWKEPVFAFADLPKAPTADNHGDVRMVSSLQLAFMYDAGSGSWQPLAAKENGDLDVKRHLIIGNNATVGKNLEVRGSIKSQGNMQTDQSATADGHIESKKGDIGAHGSIYADLNVNAGVDVESGRHVYAVQDVTAERDVIAGRNMTAKEEVRAAWAIVSQSAVMESFTVNYIAKLRPGDTCHIPRIDDRTGNMMYIFPINTLTAEDGTGIPIVCGPDKIFHYVNQ